MGAFRNFPAAPEGATGQTVSDPVIAGQSLLRDQSRRHASTHRFNVDEALEEAFRGEGQGEDGPAIDREPFDELGEVGRLRPFAGAETPESAPGAAPPTECPNADQQLILDAMGAEESGVEALADETGLEIPKARGPPWPSHGTCF